MPTTSRSSTLGPAARPGAVPDDIDSAANDKASGRVELPLIIRWSGTRAAVPRAPSMGAVVQDSSLARSSVLSHRQQRIATILAGLRQKDLGFQTDVFCQMLKRFDRLDRDEFDITNDTYNQLELSIARWTEILTEATS
jgi:hypothetical protein